MVLVVGVVLLVGVLLVGVLTRRRVLTAWTAVLMAVRPFSEEARSARRRLARGPTTAIDGGVSGPGEPVDLRLGIGEPPSKLLPPPPPPPPAPVMMVAAGGVAVAAAAGSTTVPSGSTSSPPGSQIY